MGTEIVDNERLKKTVGKKENFKCFFLDMSTLYIDQLMNKSINENHKKVKKLRILKLSLCPDISMELRDSCVQYIYNYKITFYVFS